MHHIPRGDAASGGFLKKPSKDQLCLLDVLLCTLYFLFLLAYIICMLYSLCITQVFSRSDHCEQDLSCTETQGLQETNQEKEKQTWPDRTKGHTKQNHFLDLNF